jgi:hypothetical protein
MVANSDCAARWHARAANYRTRAASCEEPGARMAYAALAASCEDLATHFTARSVRSANLHEPQTEPLPQNARP